MDGMLTERKVEAGTVGREKPKHKNRLGRMWGQSLVWFGRLETPSRREGEELSKAEMLKHNQSGNFP